MTVADLTKQLTAELPEKIKKLLAKQPMNPVELADELDVSPSKIDRAVRDLQKRGTLIALRPDGRYDAKHIAPERGDATHTLKDRGDGWQVFGITTDNHMCNRHSRLDVVNHLYDVFADEGVKTVYNCGNWIDGEARFNKQELLVFGMDNQLDYFIQNFPQRKGITTHYIAGDDHEGWYAQRECINIGRHLELMAHAAGRRDLVYLGYGEADVKLQIGDQSAVMRVMHPGGGSAYALSYAPQKIVEAFQGGEKPDVLLIGHYHKFDYCYPREVHIVSCGTTCDQTLFMRKKKLAAHVGGCVVKFKQDPKDGHIERFTVEWIPFYDRGYYESRFE